MPWQKWGTEWVERHYQDLNPCLLPRQFQCSEELTHKMGPKQAPFIITVIKVSDWQPKETPLAGDLRTQFVILKYINYSEKWWKRRDVCIFKIREQGWIAGRRMTDGGWQSAPREGLEMMRVLKVLTVNHANLLPCCGRTAGRWVRRCQGRECMEAPHPTLLFPQLQLSTMSPKIANGRFQKLTSFKQDTVLSSTINPVRSYPG